MFPAPPQKPKSRILVIRGGAIGDFVLTLPALRLLRDNFPDAHLEILGYKHIIALAENRFYAQATRSIEYGPLAGFFSPKSELDPELVGYFGSFNQVISYLFDPDGFFEGNLRRCGVKNLIAASPKVGDEEHAARHLARPLERLALYLEDGGARIFPSDGDRALAGDFLRGADGPIIALHPGSGSERKNWPVQKWLTLGEWLLAGTPRPTLVVVGGEADDQCIATLRKVWIGQPVRWAVKLDLPHAAAILERSQLFLGHDSGISHIAAAVGTRCVLLFGATDPDVWAPQNANVRVLAAAEVAIATLPVERVQEAIIQSVTG